MTSTMTLLGACGLPLVSKPSLSFFSPLSLFCHKFRCFSHSFRWAGVNWLPTIVVDFISWPNFSTWSLLWLMSVDKWRLMASGVWKRVPSTALPTFSSENSENAQNFCYLLLKTVIYNLFIHHFTSLTSN